MMKETIRSLISSAVAFFLPASLLALSPQAGPPEIYDLVWIYDSEGRGGAIETQCNPDSWEPWAPSWDIGGETELFLDTDLETAIQSNCGLDMILTSFTNQDTGRPYYVKRFQPDLGCLSTFGLIGAYYGGVPPSYILPVPFSEYDIPEISETLGSESIGPSGHAAKVSISRAFIANDPTTFTMALRMDHMFDAADMELPGPTITVEYLPGNTRSGVQVIPRPAYQSSFQLRWSDPQWDDNLGIQIIQLGLPVPEGPVAVSIHFDGYTTDTVHLDIEDLKIYRWKPVLGPDGGPIPDGFVPSNGILEQAVQDALLGGCIPCATLSGAGDPNNDGCTDAADFLVQGPE